MPPNSRAMDEPRTHSVFPGVCDVAALSAWECPTLRGIRGFSTPILRGGGQGLNFASRRGPQACHWSGDPTGRQGERASRPGTPARRRTRKRETQRPDFSADAPLLGPPIQGIGAEGQLTDGRLEGGGMGASGGAATWLGEKAQVSKFTPSTTSCIPSAPRSSAGARTAWSLRIPTAPARTS